MSGLILGAANIPRLSGNPSDDPNSGKNALYFVGDELRYKNPSGTVFTLSTGVTAEQVEDIVGALISGSADIGVSYDDPGDSLDLSLLDTAVVAGTYGGAAGIPQLTIDAKGRVTNAVNGPALVLGDNFAQGIDTSNVTYTTNTAFEAYSFTQTAQPPGLYRIAMLLHYEPGATNANDIFTLRINGTQIGLEFEDEGKDTGGDIRKIVCLVGYYNHAITGDFDIELWANQDGGGTSVIHGVQYEKWRVTP